MGGPPSSSTGTRATPTPPRTATSNTCVVSWTSATAIRMPKRESASPVRTVPAIEAPVPIGSEGFGPGAVLQLIREAGEITRGDLIARTGLGRSAVAQRIDALVASDLLTTGEAPSTGGRPPATLMFNPRSGLVLAADLGATHSRLAVVDLAGNPLAEVRKDIRIAEGPEVVLDWVQQGFEEVLNQAAGGGMDVRAIGRGAPGPVEFPPGRPVSPP